MMGVTLSALPVDEVILQDYEVAHQVLVQLDNEIKKKVENEKPDDTILERFSDPADIEDAKNFLKKEQDFHNRFVEGMAEAQEKFQEFASALSHALAAGIDGNCADAVRAVAYLETVKWYSNFLTEQLQLDKEKIEKPTLSLSRGEEANAS